MFTRIKTNVVLIAMLGVLSTATITAPLTKMFGKHFETEKDFTCCKNDKLVINHYYTINLLWINIADGYTQEKTNKVSAGGCNIRCND